MFHSKQEIIIRELQRNYYYFLIFFHLKKHYSSYFQVGFKVELATGSSPKAVALKSAMKLQATWVILDRSGEIKRDKLNSLYSHGWTTKT